MEDHPYFKIITIVQAKHMHAHQPYMQQQFVKKQNWIQMGLISIWVLIGYLWTKPNQIKNILF